VEGARPWLRWETGIAQRKSRRDAKGTRMTEIKVHDGTLNWDESGVELSYSWAADPAKKAAGKQRRLPYTAIAAVDTQAPHGITPGWVRFVPVGQTGTLPEPKKDPNALLFSQGKAWKLFETEADDLRSRVAAAVDKQPDPALLVAAPTSRRGQAKAEVSGRRASFEGITVTADRIQSHDGSGPLPGATARVENAGEITSRLSATRLVAFGALGLLARKKVDLRELYLTVEGDGFSIVRKLDAKKDGEKARRFAAELNALAGAAGGSATAPRAVAAPAVPPTPPPADPIEQIQRLAQLHDAGVLTTEEFEAKKAELLSRM
jgi:hypothetical protein